MRVYTRDAELLGITADNVPSTQGGTVGERGGCRGHRHGRSSRPGGAVYLLICRSSPGTATHRCAPAHDGRRRGPRASPAPTGLDRQPVASDGGGRDPRLGREFLGGIALTGIPQPLDYLLTEAASRYGLVRVGATPRAAYVSSTDGTLLRTLVVDHSIGSLGLVRSGDRLESRYDRDLVFWALSEARYPVAAENAAGEIVTLARRQASRITAAAATDTTGALIERLRVGSSADPDVTGKAWLARQLDVAIKNKVGLTVTVRMPDGSDVDYQLEPASVGGGRLRARDRRSGIERTLPLTSIVAVAPME